MGISRRNFLKIGGLTAALAAILPVKSKTTAGGEPGVMIEDNMRPPNTIQIYCDGRVSLAATSPNAKLYIPGRQKTAK